MTKEQIIKIIKEHKELYMTHLKQARKRLMENMSCMTSYQIHSELEFIGDMEHRCYALLLLLEEIEEEK